MDDSVLRQYFMQPTHIFHRQYEALRAVFVEGRSQKDVSRKFGFGYHSFRQLVYEFRHTFDQMKPGSESPFFAASVEDGVKPGRPTVRSR